MNARIIFSNPLLKPDISKEPPNTNLIISLFLTILYFSISENNEISIILDGDNGIKVEDCMFISRAIEANLDRDVLDFSMKVSSFGATSPLVVARQYPKHYGRILSVKTTDNKYEGKLLKSDGKSILLAWKERQPKPIGKGKITVEKSIDINFNKDVWINEWLNAS